MHPLIYLSMGMFIGSTFSIIAMAIIVSSGQVDRDEERCRYCNLRVRRAK